MQRSESLIWRFSRLADSVRLDLKTERKSFALIHLLCRRKAAWGRPFRTELALRNVSGKDLGPSRRLGLWILFGGDENPETFVWNFGLKFAVKVFVDVELSLVLWILPRWLDPDHVDIRWRSE